MSDVILKHLDAIAASLSLLQAQIEAARHAVQIAAPIPKVSTPGRVSTCDGIPDVHCARMNEDAVLSKASFGDPTAAVCRGCGEKVTLALTA